jgi:hypothetical protein
MIRDLAAILVFTGMASAQTSRGTVTGTVLDAAGANIPGARVKSAGWPAGTISNNSYSAVFQLPRTLATLTLVHQIFARSRRDIAACCS